MMSHGPGLKIIFKPHQKPEFILVIFVKYSCAFKYLLDQQTAQMFSWFLDPLANIFSVLFAVQ